MPYGIKNETPEQTKWMEKCVNSITGTNKRTDKPYTKGEKIAICKVQLKKTGTSEEAISEESLREQFYNFEEKIREALSPMRDMVQPSYGPYVADVFDDYVIVEKDNDLYKVPYTMKGDNVSFDWSSAVEVKRMTVYEPVGEAEREVITKVPSVTRKDGGRVVTYGGRTVN